MKILMLVLAAAALTATAAPAQQDDGAARPLVSDEKALEPFRWVARPVVVFADSANDPRFRQQMDLLMERPDALLERDVVVITDTDPSANSPVRQKLRPRGFMLAVIGKDGQVELRKPSPWDVREITRAIDKMPLRQQEIRDSKARRGEG